MILLKNVVLLLYRPSLGINILINPTFYKPWTKWTLNRVGVGARKMVCKLQKWTCKLHRQKCVPTWKNVHNWIEMLMSVDSTCIFTAVHVPQNTIRIAVIIKNYNWFFALFYVAVVKTQARVICRGPCTCSARPWRCSCCASTWASTRPATARAIHFVPSDECTLRPPQQGQQLQLQHQLPTQDTPLAIISVIHDGNVNHEDDDDDDETQFKPTIIAHCKL